MIYLLDTKTKATGGVTRDDLAILAEAVTYGAGHIDKDWGRISNEKARVLSNSAADHDAIASGNAVLATIVDELIDPSTGKVATDALAWHYIDDQNIRHIDVGWQVIQSVGGGKFVGTTADTYYVSLSLALGHEVEEDDGDPFTNGWSLRGDYKTLVAQEVCDPVEGLGYIVTTKNGTKCALPNYVLPGWFDPYAPPGTRLDRLGECTHPLEITPGGYLVKMTTSGQESQEDMRQGPLVAEIEWGEKVPEWKKRLRRPRIEKRLERAKALLGKRG